METLIRYRWIFIFFLGGIFSVGGGALYWNQHKDAYLSAAYARQGFLLLDDQTKFFGTKNLRPEERLLLIFSPDYSSPEMIVDFRQFSPELAKLAAENIQVAIVTRIRMDTMLNAKKAAKYPGRILSDPSGSVGKLVGAWPSEAPVRTWGYALVDKSFHLLWAINSEHFLKPAEVWAGMKK